MSFCMSSNKRTFSMVYPFMFVIFFLLFLCFLRFVFFSQVLQVYRCMQVNSPSVTLFANKHGYTINKEWRQEATLFRLQKETSCLEVNK